MVETGKPSLAARIAYGVGGAAGGIKNNGFEYVLLLFYSQIMGLSAVLVAAALWIALLIDAFSDPIVGYWSDNLRTKWGRRHPLPPSSRAGAHRQGRRTEPAPLGSDSSCGAHGGG